MVCRTMNRGLLPLAKCLAVSMCFAVSVCLVAGTSSALPFNDDMVHDQLKVSEVMRPAPAGSIPLGANERYVASREAALALNNPYPSDVFSVRRGKRLWAVNCSACHGTYTPSGYKAGAVNRFMPGPDLTNELYVSKPDGHYFGVIYFGSPTTIMPRYGWKLSIPDHWDIINYIRSVQGVNAGRRDAESSEATKATEQTSANQAAAVASEEGK